MNTEEIHTQCKEWAFAGKDYAFIKIQVEGMELAEDEKIQLMVKADEYLVHYQTALQERYKAVQQMVLGLSIAIIGVVIGVYTYFSLFNKYYLFYGFAFLGFWIFRKGYQVYQIPLEEIESPLDKVSSRRKSR